MNTDMARMARTIKDSEAFIAQAEQDLALLTLRVSDMSETHRQKLLSLKAEIAHERDMLDLGKRDLFIWQVKIRAAQIRAEEEPQ